MSAVKYMKITFHCENGKKINAYLKMPSPTFYVLQQEINICLFDERKLPRTELKTYWIDEDGDEIEIYNQCDYEIFASKRSERQHLQVAPLKSTAESTDGGAASKNACASDDDPTNFVIHERVECDACNVAPIVGFRYKCIQCPNYDLCQRCEAQHKHAEHMMVRMPNENCPTVVESWISGGRCGRRGSTKRSKGSQCPFAQGNINVNGGFYGIPTAPPQSAKTSENCGTATGKQESGGEHHHGRKHHHRRSMRHGLFSHLYDVMQDLAEGGTAHRNQEDVKNATADAATDAAKAACEAAFKASDVAAKAAHEAATIAAQDIATAVTSEIFKSTNTKAQEKTAESKENELNENVDNGATTTKTPPSTPDTTESNNVSAESVSKQSTKSHTEQSIPVLPPTIENLVQLVDPQYMKAGIQILNNFSEMFAKMLDPMDDTNAAVSCPFQTDRKSSTSSSSTSKATSSSTSSMKTTVENSTITKTDNNVEKPTTATPTSTTVPTPAPSTPTPPTPVPSTPSSEKSATPERRRSQSEENDWQIIDKQPNTPNESFGSVNISISNATSTDSIDTGVAAKAIAAAVPATTSTASTQINYEQLSKDLKAHVEKEQQREQEIKETQTGTVPKKAEEKRTVYHEDQRINDSVIAMMAMGFSNEGAWLTQLLESVNGNIAEALDVMNAAQRYK